MIAEDYMAFCILKQQSEVGGKPKSTEQYRCYPNSREYNKSKIYLPQGYSVCPDSAINVGFSNEAVISGNSIQLSFL